MSVWSSLGITLAVQILVALVIYVPPVLAPVAQADVGVAASSVGVVTAAVFAAATYAALLSGGPIARYGALRVSQASLLLCGAGLAVMASANVWMIVLGALVIGLGYGPVTPASSALLAERAPPSLRAFIFSLKQTGVPIGGALAGTLMPALLALVGWRGAVLVAAAGCAALALALQPLRVVRSVAAANGDAIQSTPQPAGMLQSLRLVMHHPRLRELALASFSYSGMQNCLGSFLVVYLHDRVGFGVGIAGLALALAMSAGIGGRVLWGLAADHWVPPGRLLGWLGVAMSLSAFLLAAITPEWPRPLTLALSLAFGLSAVGWNGVYLAEVARITARGNAAVATGAALAMTYAGVVVMPLLFWVIVQAAGSYALAYTVAGGLTTLAWRSAAAPARPPAARALKLRAGVRGVVRSPLFFDPAAGGSVHARRPRYCLHRWPSPTLQLPTRPPPISRAAAARAASTRMRRSSMPCWSFWRPKATAR